MGSSSKSHHLPALEQLRFVLLALSLVFIQGALAGELPAPSGRVILTISGNIENTNAEGVAKLDRAMLESIASRHFSTKTPWTDTASEFEGPTVRALLNYVGAKSDSFHLVAHDDYRVQVTGIDFDKYPAIFALKQNGKYMSLRNKGPAWLLFPWDDYPELHSEVNSSMSVWQLKEMVVD